MQFKEIINFYSKKGKNNAAKRIWNRISNIYTWMVPLLGQILIKLGSAYTIHTISHHREIMVTDCIRQKQGQQNLWYWFVEIYNIFHYIFSGLWLSQGNSGHLTVLLKPMMSI